MKWIPAAVALAVAAAAAGAGIFLSHRYAPWDTLLDIVGTMLPLSLATLFAQAALSAVSVVLWLVRARAVLVVVALLAALLGVALALYNLRVIQVALDNVGPVSFAVVVPSYVEILLVVSVSALAAAVALAGWAGIARRPRRTATLAH